MIINYVVKYQNNFVSSYLFTNSFKEIIEKGIDIQVLLDSNVFIFNFDFDDWPTSHPNS